MKRRYVTAAILVLILIAQVFLRVPFLEEPLERDEGAYAYIAQRILAGDVPYRDIFDHKPPLIYFIYAGVFKLFGDTQAAIRLFTLFFSLFTTLSVFAVGFLLWGSVGGLLSALIYAFYSGGPFVQGTSANTETFMVLPLILALACVLLAFRRPAPKAWGWIFLAGLLSGMAVVLKQVALPNFAVLAAFLLFKIYLERKDLKKLLSPAMILAAGFLVFPLFFAVYFWVKGAFADLIQGLFVYSFAYTSRYKIWEWQNLRRVVLNENLALWALSFFGMFLILFRKRSFELILLLGWTLASLLAVFMGKRFFGHYFIQIIPGLALLSAYFILVLFERKRSLLFSLAAALLLSALFGVNLGHWGRFLFMEPEEISIRKYESLYFVIAPRAAEFIRARTSPEDHIFVWGAEPEVYFYSRRKSASKHIYHYPLLRGGLEARTMLDRVLKDIKEHQPEYMIFSEPLVFMEVVDVVKSDYVKVAKMSRWTIWKRKAGK